MIKKQKSITQLVSQSINQSIRRKCENKKKQKRKNETYPVNNKLYDIRKETGYN